MIVNDNCIYFFETIFFENKRYIFILNSQKYLSMLPFKLEIHLSLQYIIKGGYIWKQDLMSSGI